MSDVNTKPRVKTETKTERQRLHKVILVNDDYTPREFVVVILKAEFRFQVFKSGPHGKELLNEPQRPPHLHPVRGRSAGFHPTFQADFRIQTKSPG